jgi:cytidylate kinase
MKIIAVDGPSGSGKGTIASYLALEFHLQHIDSGLLYRFAAMQAQELKLDPLDCTKEEESRIRQLIQKVTLEQLNDPNLRLESIATLASKWGSFASIRKEVNHWIHQFYKNLNPEFNGLVVDGRDIGTAVFPRANCKIFITADEDVRIQRRISQINQDHKLIRVAILERDKRDTHRKVDPLKIPRGAKIIDTSNLSIDEACKIAAEYVSGRCFNQI